MAAIEVLLFSEMESGAARAISQPRKRCTRRTVAAADLPRAGAGAGAVLSPDIRAPSTQLQRMEPDALTTQLDAALAGGGSLQAVVAEIDQVVFDDAQFSDTLFDHLLRALGSPLLCDHREALSLIKLFEDQGELLQTAQRALLVNALPDFVAAVRDEIAAFLAVEVWVTLAEPQRAAFDGLLQLQSRVTPQRLTVLVHLFGPRRACHQRGDHADPILPMPDRGSRGLDPGDAGARHTAQQARRDGGRQRRALGLPLLRASWCDGRRGAGGRAPAEPQARTALCRR